MKNVLSSGLVLAAAVVTVTGIAASTQLLGQVPPPMPIGFVNMDPTPQNKNYVSGWACVPGSTEKLKIHLYNGSTFMAEGIAEHNNNDPGITAACGDSGHIFIMPIPNQFRTASPITLRAYAINPAPNAVNPQLWQAPQGSSNVFYVNNAPIGDVHAVSPTGVVRGWTCNPAINQSFNVHVYFGGPFGVGQHIGTATANENRPDVASACTGQTARGFTYNIPSQYLDGQVHQVYVYALQDAQIRPVLPGSGVHFETIALTTLSVVGSARNSPNFTRGGNVIFDFTIQNTGPNTAANVVLRSQIPFLEGGSATFMSELSSIGCTLQTGSNSQYVECQAGSIDANQNRTVTVGYHLGTVNDACMANGWSYMESFATAFASNAVPVDPPSSVIVNVQCPSTGSSPLLITPTIIPGTQFTKQGHVTYRIVVKNTLTTPMTSVRLGLPMPQQAGTIVNQVGISREGTLSPFCMHSANSNPDLYICTFMLAGGEEKIFDAQYFMTQEPTAGVPCVQGIDKVAGPFVAQQGTNPNVIFAVPDITIVCPDLSSSSSSSSTSSTTTSSSSISSIIPSSSSTPSSVAPSSVSTSASSITTSSVISSSNSSVQTSSSSSVSSPTPGLTATLVPNIGASATVITYGSTITYNIILANTGTAPAVNVFAGVAPTIQNGIVTFISPASPAAAAQLTTTTTISGNCAKTDTSPFTICKIDKIGPGEGITLQYTFKVTRAPGKETPCEIQKLQAEFKAVADNAALVQTNFNPVEVHCVAPPTEKPKLDVVIGKNASEIPYGGTVEYIVKVTNIGTVLAKNVVAAVTPKIAEWPVKFNAAISIPPGCVITSGNTAVCTVKEIPAFEAQALRFVFRVGANSPPCKPGTSQTLEASALVAAEGVSPIGKNYEKVLVTCAAANQNTILNVAVEADVAKAALGDSIRYEVVVANAGTAPAQSVLIDMPNVPAGLILDDTSSSRQCKQVDNGGVFCTTSEIKAGKKFTFSLVFLVKECSTNEFIMEAKVSATNADSKIIKTPSVVCVQ